MGSLLLGDNQMSNSIIPGKRGQRRRPSARLSLLCVFRVGSLKRIRFLRILVTNFTSSFHESRCFQCLPLHQNMPYAPSVTWRCVIRIKGSDQMRLLNVQAYRNDSSWRYWTLWKIRVSFMQIAGLVEDSVWRKILKNCVSMTSLWFLKIRPGMITACLEMKIVRLIVIVQSMHDIWKFRKISPVF